MLMLSPAPASAAPPAVPARDGAWDPLVRRLAADGFEPVALAALFARPDVRFDPQIMARKMNAMLDLKLSPPRPRADGAGISLRYLNPFLLLRARGFLNDNRRALAEARRRFGVPPEVITALLLVETKLGSNMGDKSALITLASMALAGDYSLVAPLLENRDLPPNTVTWLRWRTAQKAAWAYTELKALLVYAYRAGYDPTTIPGSVYGAIGMCQFMPTNALRYGVDLNGDGRVDLFSATDAALSAASFLAAHGWREGLDREAQLAVLYRYNHSRSYSRTIMAVADRLRDDD